MSSLWENFSANNVLIHHNHCWSLPEEYTFSTCRIFVKFVRFLLDFCTNILEQNSSDKNFCWTKIFFTKLKLSQFWPTNFCLIKRYTQMVEIDNMLCYSHQTYLHQDWSYWVADTNCIPPSSEPILSPASRTLVCTSEAPLRQMKVKPSLQPTSEIFSCFPLDGKDVSSHPHHSKLSTPHISESE